MERYDRGTSKNIFCSWIIKKQEREKRNGGIGIAKIEQKQIVSDVLSGTGIEL